MAATNPASGGEYDPILGVNLNPTAVRKGIVTDILIRDYHGPTTDLSDPAVGLTEDGLFTPFAQDGLLRDDLLIGSNSGDNLGFYHIGLLTEDGTRYTPEVSNQETMAAQMRRSVRVDITREDDRIRFVAEESTPLTDALMDDVPLLALDELGKIGYGRAKPANGNIVERQIVALLFDGFHRSAKVFPRAARSDVGETQWSKSDPDVLDLTYTALLCPFTGYPVSTLREGEGWRGLGGSPVFAIAPVGTQTGATTATVAHAIPTSSAVNGNDEFTYTAEKSVSPYTSWTTAAIGSTTGTTTLTHNITGLTTATTYKARITATGSNGLSTTSLPSNTFTTA